MINQLIRYLPIIKFIDKNKPKTVCEIGSGSYGIGKFLNIEFIGIDSNFEDYSGLKTKNINSKMKQIIAYANNIPLEDSSMELVFSLDTFEHINDYDREHSLNEMIRVSKKNIIIGFPCGKKAQKIDVLLNKYYSFLKIKTPLWLSEHLENKYIDDLFLDNLIKKAGYNYFSIKNENNIFHFLLILAENTPIINKILISISKIKNYHFLNAILSIFNFGKCYRKIYFITKK
jgi:ubiquinone/menaquinone biosynthesis C-methylase UbiE